MTDQPEPYRSDAYISNRLDSIFGQYRPVIDQDEPEDRGESTDALIARVLGDDALRAIEMHREREAARAIDLHNGQQLRAALEEARAAGVDVGTWESFRDAWERSESLAGQMARMSPEERKQLRVRCIRSTGGRVGSSGRCTGTHRGGSRSGTSRPASR